jgi:hypothetical protein
MSSFDIDVTRDGGWWMVHIPALRGLTQARFPGEVELTAREYIAVTYRNLHAPGGSPPVFSGQYARIPAAITLAA